MFQTELIKFIQSFEDARLTYLMTFITDLGYPGFFAVLILIIIFGIDFKKGFIIIQVLLLTAAVTEFLKNTFALPRPYHVDSNVIQPDKSPTNDAPFVNRGAAAFFGLLPREVIEFYRLQPGNVHFGLPSGHTSSAVTFWGSLILLFKNKWVKYLSIMMIVLVPLSRLYLGRHFPADILAGYILGFFILVLIYKIFFNNDKLQLYLSSEIIKYSSGTTEIIISIYLIVLPILFYILLPEYYSKFTGFWFGVNCAYIALSKYKSPEFAGGIHKRFLSVLTAVIIFLILEVTAGQLIESLGFAHINFSLFIRGALITFPGILLTITINRKLKMYK